MGRAETAITIIGIAKMLNYYSTRQAAQLLGIKPDILQKSIWLGKVSPPIKSPSNSFLWTMADIEKAAWALHCFDRFQDWQKGGK